VPVNDSGSFSVYPQEYVDQENTCSEFVTQGSTDVDSPQVGATGGNFGIITCNPENVQRVRVMQTLGQLNMFKTFVRYDTGLFSDKRSKASSPTRAPSRQVEGRRRRQARPHRRRLQLRLGSLQLHPRDPPVERCAEQQHQQLDPGRAEQERLQLRHQPCSPGHLTPVKGKRQVEPPRPRSTTAVDQPVQERASLRQPPSSAWAKTST
jgi:hypothetical protein